MKKRINAVLALLLAFVLVLSFAACTENNGTVTEISRPSSEALISESSQESEPESSSEPEFNEIEDADTKYFVNKLSPTLRECFESLYDAAVAFRGEVKFPTCITESELSTLMYLLNYDCPELIHVSGDYRPLYSDQKTRPIEGAGLYFTMEKKQYDTARQELEDYISELRDETSGMDEITLEKTVYDKIFYGCTYNEGHSYAGSVYGALICGQARCEGLCKAFMWCMRKLGGECLCVCGLQTWNTGAMYSDHSWNIVRIGGNYYHLDLTLDNIRTTDDMITDPNYGFFNADDEMILQEHSVKEEFSQLGVPQCSSLDMNYHIMNDLLVRSNDNIRTRLNEILGRKFTSEGIGSVSIRCEEYDDYATLSSECPNWVREFLAEYSTADFKINTYATDLSKTILIDARIK